MCVSHSVLLFATPQTVARQAPISMEFSRQEYWIELSFPSSGNLPDLGLKPGSPALQAGSLLSELPGTSTNNYIYTLKKKMLRPNHLFRFSFPYHTKSILSINKFVCFSFVSMSLVSPFIGS